MEQILNDWLDAHRAEILSDVETLVNIPSVNAPAEEGMPFGREVSRALQAALEIGKKLGFETVNYDNYAGSVSWGTEGKQIGLLSHIDVVPAGDGWTKEPFRASCSDGSIWGRGVIDDKGPMVASLYAMKAIAECRLPVKNHVRHIIGADEETGLVSIDYYKAHQPAPWGGFSPDGEFPVIHAEKGILRFFVKQVWQKPEKSGSLRVVQIESGNSINVVPSKAWAVIEGTEEGCKTVSDVFAAKTRTGLRIEKKDGRITINAEGKGCHSSKPWMGISAASLLLKFLEELPLEEDPGYAYIMSLALLFADNDGNGIGIKCEDKLSGPLTMNMGILRINMEGGSAKVEVRYPIHASKDVILRTIQTECREKGLEFEIAQDKHSLYIPVKAPIIQSLWNSYKEVSGRDEPPVVIGGGTYCRSFENFAAFGPVFPGEPELAHEPNEHIDIEELMLSAKIYVQALYQLLNI